MIEKRIYGLNLAAFLFYATGIMPVIRYDENKVFYCVFPEEEQVGKAITAYRRSDCMANIHQYLNAYRTIRDTIKEIREGERL